MLAGLMSRRTKPSRASQRAHRRNEAMQPGVFIFIDHTHPPATELSTMRECDLLKGDVKRQENLVRCDQPLLKRLKARDGNELGGKKSTI